MRRRRLDQYYTPRTATLALLDAVPHISGTVLECCSGTGAIAAPMMVHPFVDRVWMNDIDPLLADQVDTCEDAARPEYWDRLAWMNHGVGPDWVVSNPPFACCYPIIEGAFRVARRGVAMLLRVSFLEPCNDRAEFLAAHPPRLFVLPRISFTGDGKTDNVTCAWYVWDKEAFGGHVKVYTKSMMAELAKADRDGINVL